MTSNQITFVPKWCYLWFVVSTIFCAFDSFFVLLRPRSLPGGDLNKYFTLYNLYIEVDKIYADLTDQFIVPVSVLNLCECLFNVITLFVLSKTSCIKRNLIGSFFTIVVSAFTLWKTVIQLAYGLPHSFPSKNLLQTVFLCIIPQFIWVIVPLLIITQVSKRISNQIIQNAKSQTGKVKQN